MIDRRHIEQILRLNGLAPTAADEEIRSVLISARWHKEDVETAITVLRENTTTHKSRVDTLHDVFTTDKKLSPEAIQTLLGIDVEVNSTELETLRKSRDSLYIWQLISIFMIAIALAAVMILFMMYSQKVGFFYPSV
jgi:ATP-dependent Zn protease